MEYEDFERQRKIIIDREEIRVRLGSSVLMKATEDSFDYACKLKTGEVIHFREATFDPDQNEWILLKEIEWEDTTLNVGTLGVSRSDRGIEVRIVDIVWLMDAPEGS